MMKHVPFKLGYFYLNSELSENALETKINKFPSSNDNTPQGEFSLSIGPHSPKSQIWNIEPDPIREDQRGISLGRWGRELQPWV